MPVQLTGYTWLAVLALAVVGTAARADVTPCVADDLSAIQPKYNVDFPTEIQPIIDVACAGCHTGGGASGGLQMDPPVALGNLVNVMAGNASANMPRITPFAPNASFLFKKINCTNLNDIAGTPYGRRMPRSGPPYLSAAEQALVLDWIEQGALSVRDPDRIFGNGYEGRN